MQRNFNKVLTIMLKKIENIRNYHMLNDLMTEYGVIICNETGVS